jgi:hypothetical protein
MPNTDLLHHHLFVVQHHPDISKLRIGLVGHRLVKPGLVNAQVVGLGPMEDVRGMAGVIRSETNLRSAGLLKDYLSV